MTPGRHLLVVGEALVDLLPAGDDGRGNMLLEGRFGGSPANVAVGLARLDVPVGFAGRLARSGYGPWIRKHLEAEGIDMSASVDAGEACTLAVVTLDGTGAATYEFYGPGTADWAWELDELPDPASLAGRGVHTGSLATALPPGAGVLAEWLRLVRERGDVAISYDPNIRVSLLGEAHLFGRVVAPLLASAHLVKVSEDDLEAIHPGTPIEDVARAWLAPTPIGPGPEVVVVTRGPAGARAWHRDGRTVARPAPATAVVDTVGAGDAFNGALAAALADGLPLTEAATRANAAAAIAVTKPGAQGALPSRAEIDRMVARGV